MAFCPLEFTKPLSMRSKLGSERSRKSVGFNMNILSIRELENTRKKLQMLEGRLAELDAEPVVDPHTRQLTMRSFKKLVNRHTEEIAGFESARFLAFPAYVIWARLELKRHLPARG